MSTSETDELCRLCGSEEGIKVNIFDPETDHVKKIHKILPIAVNAHDSLPKTMCHRCSYKVNDFYEFRIKCIKAQDMFKSKLPWLKHEAKMTCSGNEGHPPMVELPLNSINFISPNEKIESVEMDFVDENDPLIVIEDSPPYYNNPTSLNENQNPQEKIVMKIKKSELKKKSKSKPIWTSKKRKRRNSSYRITEVYTTTLDSFESIGDINNDPLDTNTDIIENKSTDQIIVDVNHKSEQSKEQVTNDDIKLPHYILVTKIPNVGCVFTCEKCGRTFLAPQAASLHTCHGDVSSPEEDEGSKNQGMYNSPNHATDYYSCDECNQIFTRQSQLIAHRKKHYEVVSSSDESVRPVNRRKKHRKHKRVKLNSLETINSSPKNVIIENGIVRHSLLSSDSD